MEPAMAAMAGDPQHRASDGGGTVEIAYYSVDDLERVVARLSGE